MRRRPLVLAAAAVPAALVLALLLGFVAELAVAVDEAAYEVVKRYEAFELRRYAPYVVAEITVEAGFRGAGGEAFRPLARFIGGANEARREIPMTAPVEQQPEARGQRIPMTAPVTQAPVDAGQGRYRVAFIMPAAMTLATTPVPTDPRIELRAVPERTMAVRRYGGSWSEKRYQEHEEALRAAIDEAGLEPAGDPVWARYQGPFTPWFLRRNEVMIEVTGAADGASGGS